MQRQIEENYAALEQRIKERQAFENEHQIPPYILYKTTIDFLDHNGLSLLSYAVALGDIEKVKECLKNGANINVADGQPLKTALSFGHVQIAKYLYEQGATCYQHIKQLMGGITYIPTYTL